MLEITSLANTSITKIPIDVWSKVIRTSNMVKRATEEEDIIMKELINMNERLIKEHSLVLINIEETKLCALSRDNWSGVKSGPPVQFLPAKYGPPWRKVVRAYKSLQR